MSKEKNLVNKLLSLADIKINGNRDWDIQIDNEDFYTRVIKKPSLGLGESFMDGWWHCKSLDQLFTRILSARLDQKLQHHLGLLLDALSTRLFNYQSKDRSRKVAEIHYNLDNNLYRKMLGPSMAYTCAYYKDTEELDAAQYAKYDLVCKKLQLKPGDKVLELGCGWGGFAHYATTNYQCEMTCVNISREQVKFAQEHCKDLPVNFHLCDYRDDSTYNNSGISYDKVVSIGLCEHVGVKNYKDFMKVAHRNMKHGALFLLHTIGSNITKSQADPWIRKYIFPGGALPSIKQLSNAWEKFFIMEDCHNFGAYYDKTLMAWYKNFKASWDSLKDKYDDRFYRMWTYYLLACAGMFRARDGQLWQIVFSKGGISDGYESIR